MMEILLPEIFNKEVSERFDIWLRKNYPQLKTDYEGEIKKTGAMVLRHTTGNTEVIDKIVFIQVKNTENLFITADLAACALVKRVEENIPTDAKWIAGAVRDIKITKDFVKFTFPFGVGY